MDTPPPQPRRDRARDVRRGGTRRERRRASRRSEPARIAQRGDGEIRTRRAIGSSVDGTGTGKLVGVPSSFVNGSHSPFHGTPASGASGEGPATPSSSSRPPLSPLAPASAPVSGPAPIFGPPRRRRGSGPPPARGRPSGRGSSGGGFLSALASRLASSPGVAVPGMGTLPFAFGSGSGSRGGGGGRRGREAASCRVARARAGGARRVRRGKRGKRGLAALAFPRLDGPEREPGRDDTLARGSNAIELRRERFPPRVAGRRRRRLSPVAVLSRSFRERSPSAAPAARSRTGRVPGARRWGRRQKASRGMPRDTAASPRCPWGRRARRRPRRRPARPAEDAGGVRGGVGGRRVAFRAGRRGGRFRRPRRRRRCRRDVPRNVRVRPGRRGGGARARAAGRAAARARTRERRSAELGGELDHDPGVAKRRLAAMLLDEAERPWPFATSGAARLRPRRFVPRLLRRGKAGGAAEAFGPGVTPRAGAGAENVGRRKKKKAPAAAPRSEKPPTAASIAIDAAVDEALAFAAFANGVDSSFVILRFSVRVASCRFEGSSRRRGSRENFHYFYRETKRLRLPRCAFAQGGYKARFFRSPFVFFQTGFMCSEVL